MNCSVGLGCRGRRPWVVRTIHLPSAVSGEVYRVIGLAICINQLRLFRVSCIELKVTILRIKATSLHGMRRFVTGLILVSDLVIVCSTSVLESTK